MVIFVPQASTVLKLLFALFSVILPAVPVPDDTKFAVPPMVRFPPDCVIAPPEISVRFLVKLTGAVLTIVAELLLIIRVPAVIRLISPEVRPRFEPESAPPRSTPAPRVRIVTVPVVVVLTLLIVLLMFKLLAVRVTVAPFVLRLPPAARLIPSPVVALPGVKPVRLISASEPVELTFDPELIERPRGEKKLP